MRDHVRDDVKEQLYFLLAALQVLRGQQINGDHFDIGIAAPRNHLSDFLRTLAVTMADIGETSLTRPPTIAIGHDGDVLRLRLALDQARQPRFISWVSQLLERTHAHQSIRLENGLLAVIVNAGFLHRLIHGFLIERIDSVILRKHHATTKA